MSDARPRAVVCGTVFGQVYLEAFRSRDFPFALAGVVSNGSERSRACAARYGVPLFTSVEAVPDDVTAACVVVRSGLLGGRGTDLARAFLERGIHVVQEHPLHHDELAECLRLARRRNAVYHLNSFYVHLPPVRRFVAAARALFREQRPLYVDVACGFQLAYALLDILAATFGSTRPYAIADPPPPREPLVPFRSVEGVFAGVPLTLRIQNQLDPADPDNFAHLTHRITAGTEGGSLTLVDTHGPIVWTPRPRFPRDVRSDRAAPHFAAADDADIPGTTVIGPASAPPYEEIFRDVWPLGVAHALRRLRRAIDDREDPLRSGQTHLSLCRFWQELTAGLGPPDLLHEDAPRPLTRAMLARLEAAADEAERSA